MNNEALKNIFLFLEKKEGKAIPKKYIDLLSGSELIKLLETHTSAVQLVTNDIHLERSNITKLPADLYVDGFLILANCTQLEKLPDKLYVKGSLYLEGCKELINFPSKLYVGRNVLIGDTPLANRYTDEQIRDIVASTGGEIIGFILR